jgi:hypothetical protein
LKKEAKDYVEPVGAQGRKLGSTRPVFLFLSAARLKKVFLVLFCKKDLLASVAGAIHA